MFDVINNYTYMNQFVNAVQETAKDMNRFDKYKYPCAICDQVRHIFKICPILLATNLKEAYL